MASSNVSIKSYNSELTFYCHACMYCMSKILYCIILRTKQPALQMYSWSVTLYCMHLLRKSGLLKAYLMQTMPLTHLYSPFTLLSG